MFVEVVFPLPFRKAFTYKVPNELESDIQLYKRVSVPFGKRILTGVIVNTTKETNVKEEIKEVVDILDNQPIFNKSLLKFYSWLSEYYISSLGEALKLGFPYGTDVESKKKIIVHNDVCEKLLSKEKNKKTLKGEILLAIINREEISFSILQKLISKKNIYSAVDSLEKDSAITIITEIDKGKVSIKKINYVSLIKPLADVYSLLPELERKSPKQLKILLELINKKNKDYSVVDILKKTNSSQSTINCLKNKGIVKIFEKEIERKYVENFTEDIADFELTKYQKDIIEKVNEDINGKRFQPYLLHGVTGSGKTQVYIELIKSALKLKKTALLLVPEISLTPQITGRLTNNFREEVAVIHSRMSIGERYDSWRKIQNGKARVVIGARSALFVSLNKIGIIIIDEEHDSSYKQTDSTPKYHARDAAIMYANFNKCPIVLGSATPSIESMYNAKNGKYKLLELKERIDNAKLPVIKLINIVSERKSNRMENIFSKTLLDEIEKRLKKKEGVIIFQNRRGFSTQVFCEDCSEIETCDNCSVPMVYHINKNKLQCHYCGLIKKIPNACTHCGSISIKYFGTGTERIEDELEYYFPNAKIKRVDSDAVSKKNSLSKILFAFAQGQIDILVGTQMVSKGLDFSRVTLVGVIAAENSLWMPDFRADERTFQLLTQVSGRSGRSDKKGEVLIQTQNDSNPTLQKVLKYDYEGMYDNEIYHREKLYYPPFVRLALIEGKDLNEIRSKGAVDELFNYLNQFNKWISVSNPTPAIISRIKGFYRFQILLKSEKTSDPGGAILRKAILESITKFKQRSIFKDVKILYDIDPQSIM
ncbi:MAG: primosomal protein N' [Ignavibacteriales bacterium CG_4_9_14_3_um_filter_30_11]|nr:MAG: primosomal protein N' [Ignavibacteriales bacterium CG_4_9_14_3_um_filter_30_11]